MKNSMKRLRTFTLPLGICLMALSAGCGGSSSDSGSSGSAPTAQTKARVQQVGSQNQRSLTQSGAQSAPQAGAINGAGSGNVTVSGGSWIGAFLRNVAASPTLTRNAAIRGMNAHQAKLTGNIRRGLQAPSNTSFYYDEFLGLWVDIQDTPTQSTYTLYEDQGKTKPAGSIVVTHSADSTAYPQTFGATYQFTAGLLSGSQGTYTLAYTSANGGTLTYQDTFANGDSDKGAASWADNGDYTWSDATSSKSGLSYFDKGTFHADGSGATHMESSDGYSADFTYSADGSSTGTVSGPQPGLPAKYVTDTNGTVTVTYADGTVETYSLWENGSAPGAPGL